MIFFDYLPFPKVGPNALKAFIFFILILYLYYTNNLIPIRIATNITSPAVTSANI